MLLRFTRPVAAFTAIVAVVSMLLSSAAPVSAQVCAYNSTQGTCACPTAGGGTTCFGGQEYRSTDSTCVSDSRPCASNQVYNCSTAACACDTANYPCGGCTVATSVAGASCGGGAGTYADQCGTCTVNPYVLISPGAVQPGFISIAGDIKSSGGDVYLSNSKALRVDGSGVTQLNVGNWGSGATGFTEKVYGTLDATQICISGTCMSSWPGGTGRGGAVPMYGGTNGTTGQNTFTDSWIRQSAVGNLTLGVNPTVNGAASTNGGATVTFGGSFLGTVGTDAIDFTPPTWNSVDVGVMFWDKTTGAFRSGFSGTANNWQESKLGKGSAAFGWGPEASGDYSFAFGSGYSRGVSSFVVNAGAVTGSSAIGIGGGSAVSATNGVGIAGGSVSGTGGLALGVGSSVQAGGTSGVAIGNGAGSAGANGIAIGRGTATGAGSVVIGSQGAAGLNNTVANSLLIGGNSNVPAIYVAPSSNVAIANNIGIGTTTVPARLTITQTSSVEGIRLTSATNASPLVIRNATDTSDLMRLDQAGNLTIAGTFGGGGIGGSGTAGYLSKFTAASTVGNSLVYENGVSGSVGIGTTGPVSQFAVSKTVSGGEGGAIAIQNAVTAGANSSVALYLVPNNGGGNDLARAASVKSRQTSAGNYADLGFFTSATDTPAERMTITAAGNVGVGTTTPSNKLQVDGASAPQVYARGIGDNGYVGVDTDTPATKEAGFLIRKGGAVKWYLFTPPNSDDFSIYNNANRLMVKADGKVGIGTSAPIANLHVVGGTTAEALRIAAPTSGDAIRVTNAAGNADFFNIHYDGSSSIGTTNNVGLQVQAANNAIVGTGTGTSGVSGTGLGVNASGVRGDNSTANNNGTGVLGFNFGGSANSYGVMGQHSNANANAGYFINSGNGNSALLGGPSYGGSFNGSVVGNTTTSGTVGTAANFNSTVNASAASFTQAYGVLAQATNNNSSTSQNYGVYAQAQGGANSNNWGIRASSGGGTGSTSFGGYFTGGGGNGGTGVYAVGSGVTSIGGQFTGSGGTTATGIIAMAYGATTNWAADLVGDTLIESGSQQAHGSLRFKHSDGSIYFQTDTNGVQAVAPEIYMFGSSSGGINRMILAENTTYPTWGVAYDYPTDTMQWRSSSGVKASIAAGTGTITTTGDLVAESNSWGTGSGWITCSQNASCQCPNGSFVYAVYNYFLSYGYGYIACAKP